MYSMGVSRRASVHVRAECENAQATLAATAAAHKAVPASSVAVALEQHFGRHAHHHAALRLDPIARADLDRAEAQYGRRTHAW